MPKLMDFYERHGDDRDKFEIVGICIDYSGRLENMNDLERELKPIVEKVWNGRQIKFPILLDNSFKTWERFGIPGLGIVVLVDPKGNIVEGEEQTLAQLLDNHGQPPPALAPVGVPAGDGTSPPPAK